MAQHPQASTSNAANQSTASVLYPQIESHIDDLDDNEKYKHIICIEKELIANIKTIARSGNLIEDVSDYNILPIELTAPSTKKPKTRSKEDVIKKISELPNEDNEDEDQQNQDDEEEDSDEEQEMTPDEEEDEAGGDYIMSHFDNGEGFEDNDDADDDGTGVI